MLLTPTSASCSLTFLLLSSLLLSRPLSSNNPDLHYQANKTTRIRCPSPRTASSRSHL
ncbi:hypothetical protein BT69DRAFT_1291428 [Atractiella rhizophila]|nr:hypothetical protein BT69DRAFT_1291428 [Atractiella rhizophila]